MIQYGFQRLVLLNSAGYSRAELPLDDSVSLIAPNNTGKTSLINALQFLLINDRRRMDFGAHEFDKTRRFYFPSNSSYILLEASLPQTGTVVLGCVGKGVSHDYEYFAYKGSLDIEDFRLPNGSLVAQTQLASHLAERNRSMFRYNNTEFRDVLYGSRKSRNNNEPDFTVFRLEHPSDAPAFQQVLTRTLRLDKLSSSDVKTYLLQIFKRDLPDANIDFKQEWEKAFAEVNAERAQYLAAFNQSKRIESLSNDFESRMELRGKVLEWRPRIDAGLRQWQTYYQNTGQRLSEQEKQLREEQHLQTSHDRELVTSQLKLGQQLQLIEETDRQQNTLALRFALLNSRKQLEDQLAAAQQALDAQTTLIGQANSRSSEAIRRDQQRLRQGQNQLQQQKNNLSDNLYRRLSDVLPAEDLDRLNRVLSRSVMTLGPKDFHLDIVQLRQALSQSAPDQIQLNGLDLAINQLPPQHSQLTEAELNEQLEDVTQQLQMLTEQLIVAEQMANAVAKKQQLEQEKRQLEQELKDYDTLQQLQAQSQDRTQQKVELTHQLHKTNEELARSQELADRLIEKFNLLKAEQNLLTERHQMIERARNQRADQGESFGYLDQQEHHRWLGEPDWTLDELADRLQTYQRDCRRLQDLDRTLLQGLHELHSGGLTKYQYSDTPDAEWRKILEFNQMLPKEAEALEKKARSAVINVTASLKELRDGLYSFKGRMREFNRLISNRQLSDLNTFKIEPVDENHLVEAIDTLINTAAQVDSGESFDLFNQNSVLDDTQLDRAKQILIDEGNARQGLKVADLFHLEFVVGKLDQPDESFQDIDSAASNGTVLMAKLVTGLAMLYLMQDTRHNVQTICYLDEALALDARNQSSLIDAARHFGFSLIFASPAPLATARYCVPIHHSAGRNHISKQSWQILTRHDEVQP